MDLYSNSWNESWRWVLHESGSKKKKLDLILAVQKRNQKCNSWARYSAGEYRIKANCVVICFAFSVIPRKGNSECIAWTEQEQYKGQVRKKKISTCCNIQEKNSNVGFGVGQGREINGKYTRWEVILYQNWLNVSRHNVNRRTKTRVVVMGNYLRWKRNKFPPQSMVVASKVKTNVEKSDNRPRWKEHECNNTGKGNIIEDVVCSRFC